jgi:hypothetical protein
MTYGWESQIPSDLWHGLCNYPPFSLLIMVESGVPNVRFVPASSYLIYGNDTKLRSPQDIAFAVALFIAKKNGSSVSYYMV